MYATYINNGTITTGRQIADLQKRFINEIYILEYKEPIIKPAITWFTVWRLYMIRCKPVVPIIIIYIGKFMYWPNNNNDAKIVAHSV